MPEAGVMSRPPHWDPYAHGEVFFVHGFARQKESSPKETKNGQDLRWRIVIPWLGANGMENLP